MTIRRGRKPYGFRTKKDPNSAWKRTLSFSAKSQTRITNTRVLKRRGVNLLRERVITSNFEKDISFTLHKKTVSFKVSNFENFYFSDRHS